MMDPCSLTGTQPSNPSTVERPCTADTPTENHVKYIRLISCLSVQYRCIYFYESVGRVNI